MIYQYNKLTKDSTEVSIPEASTLRESEWVEKFNKESGPNCYYSTEIILDDDSPGHDDMEGFFMDKEAEALNEFI